MNLLNETYYGYQIPEHLHQLFLKKLKIVFVDKLEDVPKGIFAVLILSWNPLTEEQLKFLLDKEIHYYSVAIGTKNDEHHSRVVNEFNLDLVTKYQFSLFKIEKRV